MIELKDITVKRSGAVVLNKVSLTVPSGSFVSVLGESGSGKTTLLSVMCGLLVQDAGEVLFNGACVDNVPTHKRNVAVVFQDSRLFPNMSVIENVAFPLKMQGTGKEERLRIASEQLAAVHLAGMEQRRTNELSGGQRQRVALARALAAKPFAILLDEPFSGLDESLRDDMRQLVLALHEETGTTMLMVTHDAREALLMSDEMAYLAGGSIVQAGTPADILLSPASPEVSASFGSTMAIEGEVADGQFRCRKLVMPAAGVKDGPAALLRTHDGVLGVHALSAADVAPATSAPATPATSTPATGAPATSTPTTPGAAPTTSAPTTPGAAPTTSAPAASATSTPAASATSTPTTPGAVPTTSTAPAANTPTTSTPAADVAPLTGAKAP